MTLHDFRKDCKIALFFNQDIDKTGKYHYNVFVCGQHRLPYIIFGGLLPREEVAL